MDLILKCIHNYPKSRAHASEIVGRLAEMVMQFPASFANRLDEAMRQIEAITRESQDLRDENRELRETLTKQKRDLDEALRQIEVLDKEITDLREEIGGLREMRKDGELQELRRKTELLEIENTINLQDLSPSQVS